MKKKTKLAIFDLDGTLIDTREDIADACNHALRMCGHPERRLEEYNMLVGRGIANLFRGALPEEHRTDENVMRMREIFVPYYNEHIADRSAPYRGIQEMLERLADDDIRIAVASNKYQEGTELLVSRFFDRKAFVQVLGQREGRPIKPDPGIIHEIMDTIPGIKHEDVIYCGDSDVDMQTGKNAGVRTIGVTWGFRSREELSACQPWFMADSPEEILRKLEEPTE